MRQRKPTPRKGRKSPHKLTGGPFYGHTLYLCSPGTLTFTVKGQRGRYNSNGEWEAVA